MVGKLKTTPAVLMPEDVAELIGKNIVTVYRWHKRGYLPAPIGPGRPLCWDVRDVRAWMISDAARVLLRDKSPAK